MLLLIESIGSQEDNCNILFIVVKFIIFNEINKPIQKYFPLYDFLYKNKKKLSIQNLLTR